MKTFTKKSMISSLLALIMIFNLVPLGTFTSKVHAKTALSEIRLTGETVSVQPGDLPEFTVSLETGNDHIQSIYPYGSNTSWAYKSSAGSAWRGFGVNTPTATDDGLTHYGLYVTCTFEDGYEFDQNTKIYYNGVLVYKGVDDPANQGFSGINQLNNISLCIDLGTAGHELETYTITYDANGGSGTMATDTARELTPKLLPPCTFTPPEGKIFDSWQINGVSGYNYNKGSKYTYTSDTTVYAVWKDNNYIRTSNATMAPNAINSNICANDLVFTSAEPEKYSVSLWRVYDYTDLSLNTTNLHEYPHDQNFVEGHVYSIETEFLAVAPYEYDVSHEEYGSKFYINGQETVMSKAVDMPYSNLRRTERTAVAQGNPAPTHTVTFHLDGGTMTSPASNIVVVNDGSLVEKPQGLSKEGNTFDGWYTDNTFNTNFYFKHDLISADTDIYAKWIPNVTQYTVTLNPNNNTAETDAIAGIESGASINIGTPESYNFTIPAGKQFDGWQIGDNKYAAGQNFTVTSNLTAVAQWIDAETVYDIIYDFNGGNRSEEGSYVEHSVAYGMILSKANLIDNLGVTAPEGKKLDAVMINGTRYELDSTYVLNTNSNIQYLWKDIAQETFSATFELNYESPNVLMTLNNLASGSKVNEPNPGPTRNGFTFEGWYIDQTCTTPFDFENDTITANTVIYAKWNENITQKITFQLDNATVSGNVITFNVDGTDVTATVSGSGYTINGNNLEVNLPDINNVKLTLDNKFDSGKMRVTLHDGRVLAVNGNNEVTFGGLNFENDNNPHLQISSNIGGGQVGGPENISFDLTWTNTYVMVNINGKEVLGDSEAQQNKFTFNNIVIDGAGETDPNKTNVISLQNRFGDYEVSEYTINNVKYDKNNENVEITEFGWFITVPGADKYVISASGDLSIPTPKTIIWVNPDYVPENEEDAKWVSDFTISHGIAKVIEVYDENNKLLEPDEYIGQDADENGLHKGFGWIKIMPGSRVVFEFVPEYGYQLTSIAINESPLEAIDTSVNRFEIKLPNADAGNLHFAATFTKTEDIVKADSEKVKSGKIDLGNNLESGSAKLTVNDIKLSPDKIKGFENAAGDYKISNYLDIDLYNIFYKGKNDSEDVWSNKIDELDKEATITLKLADGITADDIVIVHNIHNGDKYEIIKIESYDPATNTITFKTKSFSNYAIATKEVSTSKDNENTTTDNTISTKEKATNTTTDNTSSTKETTTTTNSPKTGDNITMWIGLMLVSVLGVFVTYKYLRKRD